MISHTIYRTFDSIPLRSFVFFWYRIHKIFYKDHVDVLKITHINLLYYVFGRYVNLVYRIGPSLIIVTPF